MQIYVLRIYRRGARRLGGVLEDAQTGQSVTFRTMNQLAGLLRTTAAQADSRRRAPLLAAEATGQDLHKGEKQG